MYSQAKGDEKEQDEGKAEGKEEGGSGGQPIWFTPRQQASPSKVDMGGGAADGGSAFSGRVRGEEKGADDDASRPGSSLSAVTKGHHKFHPPKLKLQREDLILYGS